MVIVEGVKDVAVQILALIIASGLLGMGFGIFIGRATQRGRHRVDLSHPVVQERILVRPDVELFAENERLRDRLVAARARIESLEPTPTAPPVPVSMLADRGSDPNATPSSTPKVRPTKSQKVGLKPWGNKRVGAGVTGVGANRAGANEQDAKLGRAHPDGRPRGKRGSRQTRA